jgi:hypothetical protein
MLSDVKLSIAVALVAIATPVTAGTLAESIARPDAAAVKALRGQRADVAARCTLGVVYAKRNDLPRAALYLSGCDDATLPGDIAADVARTLREVRSKLEASQLSKIEVVTKPAGMQVEFDALPGETFAAPMTVWAKAGRYELRGTLDGNTYKTIVVIGAHERGTGYLDASSAHKPPAAPKTQQADFSDENAVEKQTSGPPPDLEHPNMTPGKYRGEIAQLVNENELADPLATRSIARPHRRDWLGFRLAGGMFDDGAASARAGIALAATARHALAGSVFLAGRLDYSRRGGGGEPVDALAANAGAGITLLGGRDRDRAALAALVQLRGELRLGSDTHAMMDTVSRGGLGAAAGLELALPATPITAGLRIEQGLTPLAGDARDRAVLLELGVDLR